MTQEWLTHDNTTPAETVVEMMFHSMSESSIHWITSFHSDSVCRCA